MIFAENGAFYPTIERIISEAGQNRGYHGQLRDAFIRIEGNSESYVNDAIIRDCYLSGLEHPRNPGFPPVGIWIEGCIEGRVENCKLFYFDECLRLGRPDGTTRNVQYMLFDQVQMEPSKRTAQVGGQAGLVVHYAVACTFRDCRFAVGNGPQRVDSVPIRIEGVARQLRFRDCSFQGFRRSPAVVRASNRASVSDVGIQGGDIRDFLGAPVDDRSGRADIRFVEAPFRPR